jgi:hypothetical protein
MDLERVDASTRLAHNVWGRRFPDLGMEDRGAGRVYVLECLCAYGKIGYYVGYVGCSGLEKRMKSHISGGVSWTSKNKPIRVVYLQSCTSPAAEAFVFTCLLPLVPGGDYRLIGGWTSTGTSPSPLQVHVLKEQTRMVKGACLQCGSTGHYASSCKSQVQGIRYECGCCKASVYIVGSGRSVSVPFVAKGNSGGAVVELPEESGEKGGAAPARTEMKGGAAPARTKTKGGAAPARTKNVVKKRQKAKPRERRQKAKWEGCRMLVDDVYYAKLGWHLGKEASGRQRRQASAMALKGAKEIAFTGKGAKWDGSMLFDPEYVAPFPMPFVQGRGGLNLKRHSGNVSLARVLFRCDELEKHFPRRSA